MDNLSAVMDRLYTTPAEMLQTLRIAEKLYADDKDAGKDTELTIAVIRYTLSQSTKLGKILYG